MAREKAKTVAVMVRAMPDDVARVDAWASARGMARAPALLALALAHLDHGDAPAPVQIAAPSRAPVPAMDLAAKAGVVTVEPRKVDKAREALARAEQGASHLATPKARVSVAAAADKADLMEFGRRPVVYGARLKGAAKAKR